MLNVKECVIINGNTFAVGDMVNIYFNESGKNEHQIDVLHSVIIEFVNIDGIRPCEDYFYFWEYVKSINKSEQVQL